MGSIIVAAIDCAFNNCGWIKGSFSETNQFSFQSAGIIKIDDLKVDVKRISDADMLKCEYLYNQLNTQIIDPLLQSPNIDNPKLFAYEVPGGSQSARAGQCLGMAKGIIASTFHRIRQYNNISIISVTPMEVKKFVGNNKATKNDIINFVVKNSNLKTSKKGKNTVYHIADSKYTKGEFEHIADAVIIAEVAIRKLGERK